MQKVINNLARIKQNTRSPEEILHSVLISYLAARTMSQFLCKATLGMSMFVLKKYCKWLTKPWLSWQNKETYKHLRNLVMNKAKENNDFQFFTTESQKLSLNSLQASEMKTLASGCKFECCTSNAIRCSTFSTLINCSNITASSKMCLRSYWLKEKKTTCWKFSECHEN